MEFLINFTKVIVLVCIICLSLYFIHVSITSIIENQILMRNKKKAQEKLLIAIDELIKENKINKKDSKKKQD